MRSRSKLTGAIALAVLLAFNSACGSLACGPRYPQAVLFSWNHPDMPLKTFAGGSMGVIFDTWAKSYLCVAYRYLDGKPLSNTEIASVDSMWTARLKSEATYMYDDDYCPSLSYFELRAATLHIKESADCYKVQSKNDITDGAFLLALTTLRSLIKEYGQGSPLVRQWLLAQDCVFGINSKFKISVPQKLPAGADRKLSIYRDYQIAAATFYLENYEAAQAQFARLSASKVIPAVQKVSTYMVARAAARQMYGASEVPHDVSKNLQRLDKFEKRATDLQSKLDIIDLESLQISQNISPEENLQRIVRSILKEKDAQFCLGEIGLGRDIWDLTYMLDGGYVQVDQAELDKHDLVDWLKTVSSGSSDFYELVYPSSDGEKAIMAKQDRKLKHALEKWRSCHSKAWLVAVLLAGGLRGDDSSDVQVAAEKLRPGDPAYLTAQFYLIDQLIQQQKIAEARTQLQSLNYGTMPVSTLNLFKAQQIATSNSVKDYFKAACMPVTAASSNLLLVDDAMWHHWNSPRTPLATFDEEIGRNLDRYLPWQLWIDFSRNSDLPANLKQRILCAVWIKAHLLGKHIDEAALLSLLKPLCSKVASMKISKYEACTDSTRKEFLFAQILLDNYGMSPYVEAGLPRFADKIDTFNYYQKNYWLPISAQPTARELKEEEEERGWTSVVERMNVPLAQLLKHYYASKKIDTLLSAQQIKDATNERILMEKQHPSKILAEAVLNYAKAHPAEPDVPAYLFKVVKLPRWSGQTELGTRYSRIAYLLLHDKYQSNKWTKLATCYY